MPTKNPRITFMATDEVAERFNKIKNRGEFKGMSDSEVIRRLILRAAEADEKKETA